MEEIIIRKFLRKVFAQRNFKSEFKAKIKSGNKIWELVVTMPENICDSDEDGFYLLDNNILDQKYCSKIFLKSDGKIRNTYTIDLGDDDAENHLGEILLNKSKDNFANDIEYASRSIAEEITKNIGRYIDLEYPSLKFSNIVDDIISVDNEISSAKDIWSTGFSREGREYFQSLVFKKIYLNILHRYNDGDTIYYKKENGFPEFKINTKNLIWDKKLNAVIDKNAKLLLNKDMDEYDKGYNICGIIMVAHSFDEKDWTFFDKK